MRLVKKGQISTEYLIIMGFVTFLIISVLGVAFFYVSQIKDNLKVNQVNNFANKIVNSAETVYFAGEPSKITILLYLPQGVKSIATTSSNELTIKILTDSGTNVISYTSSVPITASGITTTEGLKKVKLEASPSVVTITQIT